MFHRLIQRGREREGNKFFLFRTWTVSSPLIPNEKCSIPSPHTRSNTSTENSDEVGAHACHTLLVNWSVYMYNFFSFFFALLILLNVLKHTTMHTRLHWMLEKKRVREKYDNCLFVFLCGIFNVLFLFLEINHAATIVIIQCVVNCTEKTSYNDDDEQSIITEIVEKVSTNSFLSRTRCNNYQITNIDQTNTSNR